MSINERLTAMGKQAKQACCTLSALSSHEKNTILHAIALGLEAETDKILAANELDLQAANKANLSPALLDRLLLSKHRIALMAAGFRGVAKLPDPIGKVLNIYEKENGLQIKKIRVPIGVLAIIFESRPNVTADVAALCLKSGNAVILRGGHEALHSNKAIYNVMVQAAAHTALPQHALQLIDFPDREAVQTIVQMPEYIDCVIPRGGEGLINTVVELVTVPVIKHYRGLCHTYVDASADINKALSICENAKCQRPGVCNAMETLLVHQSVAEIFLPRLVKQLSAYKIELRGDAAAREICPEMKPASMEDWNTEYLDLILSIAVVPDLETAIAHINTYGSHHSDAIVAKDDYAQTQFAQCIDSAAVYINASTRFTDGAEFGLGAEIGISTDKLHARGPMGIEELTTYKYVCIGNGQVRC